MRISWHSMRTDDRGASLIMVAAAMVMLLGAAALVIDLATLRYDMRADRLASDAASVAGASAIEPFTGSNAAEACQIAWEYFLANVGDEGTPTAPNCSTFAPTCDPNVARTETATAPPYTVEIVHPVPDDDPMIATQPLNTVIDGVACQRIGVRVQRARDFAFAKVLGFETGTTDVRSVARIRPDVGEGDVVPLVLLEPYDCDALTADGQGKITVAHFEDSPGVIVTDSDGSGACNAAAPYIIEVQAQGNRRWIRALPVPGVDGARSAILAYALSGQPGADPTRAYNPDDLTTPIDPSLVGPTDPLDSYVQLYPQPTFRSQRVTRAPIDHRYNCLSSYPDYLGVPIEGCTDTMGSDYIDQHIGTYGAPAGVSPAAFDRWTTLPTNADGDCNVGAGENYTVSDDIWFDCSPSLVVNGGSLEIQGANAVFDGNLDMRSDGTFVMNSGATADHFAFFRDGGDVLKVAQATIEFSRTFVLLEDGFIDLVGGAGGLVWTAPSDSSYPFEDLALWSESPEPHELGGQAGNILTGTFFTPYANPFILKGLAGQLQTDAQFLTRKLVVTGFTEVLMKPDPETSTLIPIRGVSLIR